MSNFTDLETIGCDSHHKKEIDLSARHLRVPPMSKGERVFVVIALIAAIIWVAVVWFALSFPPIMIPKF
jgi:hypothetical protein